MEKIESKFKEQENTEIEEMMDYSDSANVDMGLNYSGHMMDVLDDYDQGFSEGYDEGYADALDDGDADDDYSIDMMQYESKKEDSKMKLTEGKLEEKSDDEGAKSAIKAIIATDWGGSNEEQYKNIQLMSGLAGNDSAIANKFLDKVNKFTSGLKVEDF